MVVITLTCAGITSDWIDRQHPCISHSASNIIWQGMYYWYKKQPSMTILDWIQWLGSLIVEHGDSGDGVAWYSSWLGRLHRHNAANWFPAAEDCTSLFVQSYLANNVARRQGYWSYSRIRSVYATTKGLPWKQRVQKNQIDVFVSLKAHQSTQYRTPFQPEPILGGQKLDLLKIYQTVIKAGGYKKV